MHHSIFPRDSKHTYLHRMAYCGDRQRVFECRGNINIFVYILFTHNQINKEMENIREYLESHLNSIKDIYKTDVKCIEVILTERVGSHLCKFVSQKVSKFYLKEGYNQEYLADFLEALNFEYDDTSRNRFHGNIWYTDGTWSHYTENEYSCWEYYACPTITHDLYDL